MSNNVLKLHYSKLEKEEKYAENRYIIHMILTDLYPNCISFAPFPVNDGVIPPTWHHSLVLYIP